MHVTGAAIAAVRPEVVTIAKTTVALAIGVPIAILAFNYFNAPSAKLVFDFQKVNLIGSSTGILLFSAISYAGCALITSSIAFLSNGFKRVSCEKTRDWNVWGSLGCTAYNFLQLAAIQQVEVQAQSSGPSPVQPTWWEILFGSEQPPIPSTNNIMVPSSDYLQENPDRFLISSCCLVLSSAIIYYGPSLISRLMKSRKQSNFQNNNNNQLQPDIQLHPNKEPVVADPFKVEHPDMPPPIEDYFAKQGCTPYWNPLTKMWIRQCLGRDAGFWNDVKKSWLRPFDFEKWLEKQTEGLPDPRMPPQISDSQKEIGCTPYWNQKAEKWVLQLVGQDTYDWDVTMKGWIQRQDLPYFNQQLRRWEPLENWPNAVNYGLPQSTFADTLNALPQKPHQNNNNQ